MNRFKKVISLFAAILILVSASLPAFALPQPDLELAAVSAVVINLDLGETIYTKNENEIRTMASLTKMMTALVAYDLCGGDTRGTTVQVPWNIWEYFAGFSNISVSGLVAGESFSMYDMLHALLIPSGNEAATTIAINYGYENFISQMNQKAAELGMNSTHFVNPHGLDAEGHYSTAADLAKLAVEFAANAELYEITQKVTYLLPATDLAEARTIYTTNLASIPSSGYYYSAMRGLKTGYTPNSGYCLASTATSGGARYLIVLLGCEVGKSFSESIELYRWCYNNLSIKSPIDNNTVVAQLGVTGSAEKDTFVVYPDAPIYRLFGNSNEIEVTYNCVLPESVPAPVAVGDVIGTAEVFYNGESVGTVNLIAREDIERNVFVVAMEAIGAAITSPVGMVVIGALFLILLFYLYYIKIVIPRKARRRAHKKNSQNKNKREK